MTDCAWTWAGQESGEVIPVGVLEVPDVTCVGYFGECVLTKEFLVLIKELYVRIIQESLD